MTFTKTKRYEKNIGIYRKEREREREGEGTGQSGVDEPKEKRNIGTINKEA